MATGLRQQPGLACEQCRRRKARCDRLRPQCGTCVQTGTTCVVVDKRPQRGPKKGQLKALRTQIATLEQQLIGQLGYLEPDDLQIDPDTTAPGLAMFDEMEHSMNANMEANAAQTLESDKEFPEMPDLASATSDPAVCMEWHDGGLVSPGVMTSSKQPTPSPILMLGDLDISDLMRADLDQLYFDRVHAIAPITHKRRYFAWAGQENPSPARACLRSAMRTVAAAVSAQFRSLSDALYAETRRMLETLDVSEHSLHSMTGKIQLEQVQAWLLLAHYEFLRMHEHQAMLTAGRAFRLVQLSRLYDIDTPHASPMEFTAAVSPTSPPMSDESFAEAEEKRRTFWLAFSFDRFLSTRNEWPLTLHEDMICTRLPAPETNFQNSQPIRMDFLPEAMANSGRSMLSPFAECIVLATLYGRCMTHRRLNLAASLSSKDSCEFWTRHEQLAAAVEKRTQLLVQSSPSTSTIVERDPMLAFTHMLAHSAIIYLSNTTETTPWQTVEHQLMAIMYEQRAYQAATDMVRLAKVVPRLGCFKVHPFLPNALSRAATFLMTHAKTADLASPNEEGDNGVEQLLDALRNLRDVNNLARELLYKMEAAACMSRQDFPVSY